MAEQQWYYGQEGNRMGPCSASQLRELAAKGQISPLDTIWKEGTAQGALASRVKNLFPPPPSAREPEPVPPPPQEPVAAATAPAPTSPSNTASRLQKEPAKKNRAIAIQGAKICSQDGTTVQYIKFCTKCKQEDSSRSSMVIRRGINRARFFCSKCRKTRQVEIHGKT